ncbi:pyruvate dehydrogenase (acetyl-transferring), homodimeric type [Dichelobacter nodosus]|uniref:pyruvate dehydrogenase (acetyl-transferring), homodimeric type n=1 Tax=Dichelobacter nodosus TaxID=870 RepID=UPI000E29E5C4|nr:pyruvate dehydrogenase (acetyl-transferring), homodimeric type [Dichelobacter nodosus]AXM45423.1 pyruvate dehydrogenase (acetyl-transferring), homodimeric type [Dichelobacter nodosus]TGA66618.1 pyruvate dehydrogenase (acetyl-transferring), homodimeric type [Dichelobacter nodosus]
MADHFQKDIDPQETKEWLSAIDNVLTHDGQERANYLLHEVGRRANVSLGEAGTTSYVNTIPVDEQPEYPGDLKLERVIRNTMRWNAAAMVLRANKHTNVGGHIASFTSAAILYEVGQNHFWRGHDGHLGDMIFFQGHCAPGMYARAYLEGRLTEEQLDNFRQEIDGKGIPSYPHPWLMPDFWQFPTVSMGLGPMMAIYQARFMKYMESRGLLEKSDRKIWCFCGDGEMDEPESRGSLSLAAHEKLDNLIFVINCNLQRLDGPVRGNGKIIQELEAEFKGCGWEVIKVVWGSGWDQLFARDKDGLLRKRMDECLDGDMQTFRSKDGSYIMEHFFNSPELRELAGDMTDEDIWALRRGGHDPVKVFAAYQKAIQSDRPVVILAQTIKGYGMGSAGEGQNIAHQAKKMNTEQLKHYRDHFGLVISEEDVANVNYVKFEPGSPEYEYIQKHRQALHGYLPHRRTDFKRLEVPELSAFESVLKGSGEGREISTTMAFVRVLNTLLKDKNIGQYIVPIVPDESRTFGMEGMFRQYSIWNQKGQQYTPQDQGQLMYYKEDASGQIIQEGINEAGGICDFIAAGTAHCLHDRPMIPFFIYYSMFGFQRFGDFAWAAGDQRVRGFLLGGTAGRTTLNGEGLQHEDGHSMIQAALVPNCIPYDPSFGYEVAVIVQDGLRRMYQENEDVYYYITLMNENYPQPALPEGVEAQILKGMYCLQSAEKPQKAHVQLMGAGTILNEVIEAEKLLKDWGVSADVWSCPSFPLLVRDGMETERYNRLHPMEAEKLPFIAQQLANHQGPIVVSTDYIRAVPEQVRAYLPKGRNMTVLGTDGFGRSDTRANLRRFFEVDRYHVVIAALKSLADEGTIEKTKVAEAIKKYGIMTELDAPLYR